MLLVLSFIAGSNPAQEAEPSPRGAAPGNPAVWPGQRPNAWQPRSDSRLIEALDINHDGIIDAEEMANASIALEGLDKNDDGQLTEDEYLPTRRAFPPGRRGGPPFGFRRNPPAPLLPKGGIDNFGIVDDHVLRGAQPSTASIPMLKALGVTTIIDLKLPDKSGETEKLEADRDGILYTNMPMESLARPTTEQVNAILATITNAPGKVFVHCRAGKDRTGTIVACYRILHNDWTSEQALREADEFRMAADTLRMREFVVEFGKKQTPHTQSP
jgi:protein-tyrosine phosphatase